VINKPKCYWMKTAVSSTEKRKGAAACSLWINEKNKLKFKCEMCPHIKRGACTHLMLLIDMLKNEVRTAYRYNGRQKLTHFPATKLSRLGRNYFQVQKHRPKEVVLALALLCRSKSANLHRGRTSVQRKHCR
jgi:hypothetical protein